MQPKLPLKSKKSTENSMSHFHSDTWLQGVTCFLLRMVQVVQKVGTEPAGMGKVTAGYYLAGHETAPSPSSRKAPNTP